MEALLRHTRKHYERAGFVFSHREPPALKVDERDYDFDWMVLHLQ